MNPITKVQSKRVIYQLGSIAAICTVIVAFVEMIITFLPEGRVPVETVNEWFNQLQGNWFIGLRNLGLLNIIMFSLGIPLYYALYITHRENQEDLSTMAIILSYISVAIIFATNRAFTMLDLSNQYAQAITEEQRTLYIAAGQAAISVGRSHSPGTFLGFFLGEIAGIIMSIVLIRGKHFNASIGIFGIIGFSLLSIYEICISFIPSLKDIALIIAMLGAPLNILWLILIGINFIQKLQKGE